jgi:hypothetical protein
MKFRPGEANVANQAADELSKDRSVLYLYASQLGGLAVGAVPP